MTALAPGQKDRTVILHEVGLRDGLQAEKQVVPLEQKIRWTETLLTAGVDIIQLGSFVHPGKVPQMADTDALFQHFSAGGRKPSGAVLSGLVLNEKGLERGMACGVEMFCMGVSASETHSQKNTGMSIADATKRIIAMARLASGAGKRVQLSVQSAFGCGYEGNVPPERVLKIAEQFLNAGFRSISVADTAGHATPPQVEELFGGGVQARRRCRVHLSLPQHLRIGFGQLLRRDGCGREVFRVVRGRARWLPLHQGGQRQRLHGGPGALPASPGPAPRGQPGEAGRSRAGYEPVL
jgi:isopropylmalate/homocitrate/citramalate synthase